jgi:hypothetical protein
VLWTVVPFGDKAWLQTGLFLLRLALSIGTLELGFFLRVVDGICKNCSGSEKLITCFLIHF